MGEAPSCGPVNYDMGKTQVNKCRFYKLAS